MEFESWIDRQIREAMERGAFDDLPGAGKPLHLDPDPDWWAKAKIADENLEPLLPTALSLRREVERLPEMLAEVRYEERAREIVDDLNRRIRESYTRLQSGPRIIVALVDTEVALKAWRERSSSR
jgi:type VI protein secretion system component VasF